MRSRRRPDRPVMAAWPLALLALVGPPAPAPTPRPLTALDTVRITLQAAIARARLVSSGVMAARGSVAAARGLHAEGRLPFASNPSVAYERRRRRDPDRGDEYDYQWTLSQTFEVAGQSFLRSSAADRRIGAARARVREAERLAVRDVDADFLRARLAIRRARLSAEEDSFAAQLERASLQRFEQGTLDRLAYNATVLAAARAHSRAVRAAAARDASLAELSRILGFPVDSVPWPAELPALPPLSATDSLILAVVGARRPDLQAARLEMKAAETGVTLAHRAIAPDLVLSGFTGQEEGADILGFSAGVRLPLIHHGQAAVGRAIAKRESARAILAETERRIRAQTLGAANRYRRVRRLVASFQRTALNSARENVELSQRALRAGRIDVTDLIVLRSQAVGAELDHLDILRQAYGAWFDLAAAVNASPEQLPELLSEGPPPHSTSSGSR